MGKYLAILTLVLCLSVSLPAATTISCVQTGSTTSSATFNVNYAYDGTGSFPRAFALDIATSVGTFGTSSASTPVTATKVGESVVGSIGFGIFPGTIAIDSAGSVMSYGSPIAPQSDLPSGTMAGPGTAGITVELGSLYATTAYKPANAGTLLSISIAGSTVIPTCGTPARTATITIMPNAARGGIVLEDGSSVGVFTSTCSTVFPASSATCGCKGDVNNDLKVTSGDVVPLINLLNQYGGKTKTIPSSSTAFNKAADVNLDNQVTSGDVVPLINMLNQYGGKTKTINCPHTY